MTEEPHTMIRFVPEGDGTNEGVTDASYRLPAFYELWARWGPKEDRAFWAKAAETSRAFFVKTTNPKTGLAPVYANFDGTPHVNRFPQSGEFGYDAWRTASNWSVDWSWWRKSPAGDSFPLPTGTRTGTRVAWSIRLCFSTRVFGRVLPRELPLMCKPARDGVSG